MRWEGVAWALLAVVLGGGFAWYERSRPPARIVALVAALAALAVAGRLAFAPIPNVVATTDIVLITGFAVGAAPGFAVGALAAAVSNLWLGQGPWTPWQMAGWGCVGLGGAALAAATGRRLGRGGLAVACGLAGLAYGALLDLSVMVTYGGQQSLDRYLALSARGVPFNVAHAVGNVALALAAGPALVRMISRYRSRFEFEWHDAGRAGRRGTGVVGLSVLLIVLVALPTAAAAGAGGHSATNWLKRERNSDGGFPADPGGSSSAAMTGWAALGLEATGVNPLDLRHGGPSPIAYLRAHAGDVRSTGDLERTILALEGAGVNPRRFAGRSLPAQLRKRRSRSGAFEGQVNLTAFGILALRSAGASGPTLRRSAAWLRRVQDGDGGWGFQPHAGSDPDSTGAALQGLAAAGAGGAAAHRGTSYLRRIQNRDGGFALAGATGSNSQSTAWAVQGLVAAGVSPGTVRRHGNSSLDYLAHRQAADGHYRYSSASDQTPVWVTGQALLAVNRKAFPLAAVARAPAPARATRGRGGRGVPAHSAGIGSALPASGGSGNEGGAAGSSGAATSAGGADRGNQGGQTIGSAPTTLADPASAPTEPPDSEAGDGSNLPLYFGAGFGLLIAALTAGFLWYRRRLP